MRLWGRLDLNDKNFKDTKKLHWVVADDSVNTEVVLVELDHIITKKKLEENDKLEDFVNKYSKIEYTAIAEGSIRNLQKGDII
jgi:glutamyl-tRNA synthetase